MTIVGKMSWEQTFRDTVEGRPGLFTAEISADNGLLGVNKPISKGAKPQPHLVVELLRSDIPLTKELRAIIADFLDPNAQTAFWFKPFGRRNKGRHPDWKTWHMDAAIFVEKNSEDRGTFEAAVQGAMQKYGLQRSQVTDACKILKEVRKYERSLREEDL
ncbi:hypothetical protein [Hoeflea alexandrii]|uniref:Uncharacterized protein n=1 Tax=Hoeflea alexandrii TaxID=288436 RepID=A0ABT1CTF8_9HYPH|nr:hypothetical protein [Hoeflea alexandrii]MCO6409480.1 hypothetical protein [Hoeflea alexandrii]MCY0152510.1 hypothetical protein [Hoeflea alexandrii]